MEETITNCKRKINQLREIFKNYSHLNFTYHFSYSITPSLHVVNMYADSGATNFYFRLEDVKNHRTITKNNVQLKHAGGNIMSSTHTTTMHLPTRIKNTIEGHNCQI